MDLQSTVTFALLGALAIALGVLGVVAQRSGKRQSSPVTEAGGQQEERVGLVPVSQFIRSEYFVKGMLAVGLVLALVIEQLVRGVAFHQGTLMALASCAMGVGVSFAKRSYAPLYAAFFLGLPFALISPADFFAAAGLLTPSQH